MNPDGSSMAAGGRQEAGDRWSHSVLALLKDMGRRGLGRAGLEVRRTTARDELSAWLESEPEATVGDSTWYHVGQMANRWHRPVVPRYRPGRFGDDTRLKYILYFLDVRDCRVLELGPFEGHHSVILEKMGVRQTVAVESRKENIEKCLRVKDLFRLDRTDYVLQDVEQLASGEVPRFASGNFDLVFCCGIFYHLAEPFSFLKWCLSQSSRLFMGTNVVVPESRAREVYYADGEQYDCLYTSEGGIEDPISGMSPRSVCLTEPALIALLHRAGYQTVNVLGHDLQNATPHTTLLAER